jgi:hypothetical protein
MIEKSAERGPQRDEHGLLQRYILLRNRLVWMSALCLCIMGGALMLSFFEKIPAEWGLPIAGGIIGPWAWVWFLTREAEREYLDSSRGAEGVQ